MEGLNHCCKIIFLLWQRLLAEMSATVTEIHHRYLKIYLPLPPWVTQQKIEMILYIPHHPG
jgi:hypothetical protein